MWSTRKAKRAIIGWIITSLILLALSIFVFAVIASAEPTEALQQPEVLIIQHTYDGPVEQAGVLMRYQYTGGKLLVEWADTTTDGILRNGFE